MFAQLLFHQIQLLHFINNVVALVILNMLTHDSTKLLHLIDMVTVSLSMLMKENLLRISLSLFNSLKMLKMFVKSMLIILILSVINPVQVNVKIQLWLHKQ
eukprot:c26354_g1_i1.p1 GENE.c26354_g1_i1~~c26354_g1_i1.p1  ORF type:complete len:101 (+),score=4.58 c26354_g1_i1:144-446(+)